MRAVGYRTLVSNKLIVAWGVWVPLVKFAEFFQTTRREVVVRFLRPVSTIREVKPFNEVENTAVVSASSFDTGHDFVDVVFLTLLDIVGFPKYLGRVGWRAVFVGSKGFEQ